jgi:hypothetical protein
MAGCVEENTMKRLRVCSLSALFAVGLALLPGSSGAEPKSLKEQLVGTWMLVSCDATLGNAKPAYCINPTGILMLDADGRYAMVIAARGRPGGVRASSAAQAPAEMVKEVARGLLANFGIWSVNDEAKTITRHLEGALFPSVEGIDLTASVSFNGDEVRFVGQEGSRTYRRVK